ncbi:MAG: DivIVA domain-containing protein [Candidatus Delongbacteria bacterium]|nr:DivIVA domain-containing protein [Candidatus Delongbacteria bacterium]
MEFCKDEIVNKTFKPAFKGYNKVEVEVYLEYIGEEVEKILNENADLKKKFTDINNDYQKFSKEKESFNDEQVRAKKEIEQIKRDTQKYCEQLKADARVSQQNTLKESYVMLKDLKKDIDDLKKIKESFIKRYQTYLRDQLESLKLFQKENYADDKK